MTQSFLPFDASNRVGTCRWCGDRLQDGGFAEDNCFCTMECGYLFGLTHAQQGHFLCRTPVPNPEPTESDEGKVDQPQEESEDVASDRDTE
jgi:hypothetical protein